MLLRRFILLLVSTVFAVANAAQDPLAFDPRSVQLEKASCSAIRREINSINTDTVNITIEYANFNPNATRTILLVHGWPSLWSSWARQINEFKDQYNIIVPNIRGFGGSTHPGNVRTSMTMFDIAGDLACVLGHAGVANATCLGHDWGSQVCYEFARMRPDIVTGIVGIAVPYLPNVHPYTPIRTLISAFPKLAYQVYFDTQLDKAVAELDADPARTLRSMLRTVDSAPPDDFLASNNSLLSAYDGPDPVCEAQQIPLGTVSAAGLISPIPFFSPVEEEYFINAFKTSGFRNTMGFYLTEDKEASHAFGVQQGNATLRMPVLAIYPSQDPVANWVEVAAAVGSAQFLPRLTTKVVDGAHWPQLENPIPVNIAIRRFLDQE